MSSYLHADQPDGNGPLNAEQDRFEMPANDYAPAGCVELDGVLYCVAHDGIIDELSSRIDRDGNIVCDQWDEYDDLCRMVPLFIRVTEGH